METQISRNLQRCSEIADQLQDCTLIGQRSPEEKEISSVDLIQALTESNTLAQELERLIEDLFVMTGAEAAREKFIDQKLKDAGVDPDGLVERGLKKIMDQPTARDEMPETREELADREASEVWYTEKERTLSQMTDSSDRIAETIKDLTEVYRNAMIQGEKLYRMKKS